MATLFIFLMFLLVLTTLRSLLRLIFKDRTSSALNLGDAKPSSSWPAGVANPAARLMKIYGVVPATA